MKHINEYVFDLLDIARQHKTEGNLSGSAELCYRDALRFVGNMDYESAVKRGLESLIFSIGMAHPHYKQAVEIIKSGGIA